VRLATDEGSSIIRRLNFGPCAKYLPAVNRVFMFILFNFEPADVSKEVENGSKNEAISDTYFQTLIKMEPTVRFSRQDRLFSYCKIESPVMKSFVVHC
jgi:hypothetical protein